MRLVLWVLGDGGKIGKKRGFRGVDGMNGKREKGIVSIGWGGGRGVGWGSKNGGVG